MTPVVLATLASIFGADVARELTADDAQCRIVHFAVDGRRTEAPPSATYAPPNGGITARSSSRSSTSASSSVSAHSSSNGRSVATAATRREGRSITRTHDESGCTVVIDDRPGSGAR